MIQWPPPARLAGKGLYVSNCRICSRAPACDWESPPVPCLDFRESTLPPIDERIKLCRNRYCELIVRGGARFLGWVRGLEENLLAFECEDHTVLSVDLDSGAEIVFKEEFVDEG